jgi:hypothetical protein
LDGDMVSVADWDAVKVKEPEKEIEMEGLLVRG